MPAVEVHHVPVSIRQLQTHGGSLAQPYHFFSGIDDLRGSGDHIKIFKYTIIQLYPDIRGIIDQRHYQCLSLAFLIIYRRQTRYAVLAVNYLV